MTAYLIKDFYDPKMGIIFYALNGMWNAGDVKQLCRACVALLERDKRERAEEQAMRFKVGL